MERIYTQADLIGLIGDISRAIEKHGKFVKVFDPEFRMSLDGCGFTVRVKSKLDRRKRAGAISGSGESPWEAAEKLISGLDASFGVF